MRVLGVDPGLRITGYGCVDLVGSTDPRLIEGGVLRLRAGAPMPKRLEQLHVDLGEVLEDLRPDVVVVERLFSHYKRVQTAILMGHARGVILLAAAARNLELDELAPAEIKKAVAGNGNATKAQMQEAVRSQCGLAEVPTPHDVADAIAIALCAARRLEARRLIDAAR